MDNKTTKVEIISKTLGDIKIDNVVSYDFISGAIGIVSIEEGKRIIDSFYLKDIIEFATPGKIDDPTGIVPVTVEVTLNDGKTVIVPDVLKSAMNEYGYIVFSQYTIIEKDGSITTMDRHFFEEKVIRIRTIQPIQTINPQETVDDAVDEAMDDSMISNIQETPAPEVKTEVVE